MGDLKGPGTTMESIILSAGSDRKQVFGLPSGFIKSLDIPRKKAELPAELKNDPDSAVILHESSDVKDQLLLDSRGKEIPAASPSGPWRE